MSTPYTGWRAGTPNEVERDSLADRLIWDPDLRDALVNQVQPHWSNPVSLRLRRWRQRVHRLADNLGVPYSEAVVTIILRATEHTKELA